MAVLVVDLPAGVAVGQDVFRKQSVRARLRSMAAGAADPGVLADALLLLMDGAFAAARMYQRTSPATHVAQAARALIDAHTPTGPQSRRAER